MTLENDLHTCSCRIVNHSSHLYYVPFIYGYPPTVPSRRERAESPCIQSSLIINLVASGTIFPYELESSLPLFLSTGY